MCALTVASHSPKPGRPAVAGCHSLCRKSTKWIVTILKIPLWVEIKIYLRLHLKYPVWIQNLGNRSAFAWLFSGAHAGARTITRKNSHSIVLNAVRRFRRGVAPPALSTGTWQRRGAGPCLTDEGPCLLWLGGVINFSKRPPRLSAFINEHLRAMDNLTTPLSSPWQRWVGRCGRVRGWGTAPLSDWWEI